MRETKLFVFFLKMRPYIKYDNKEKYYSDICNYFNKIDNGFKKFIKYCDKYWINTLIIWAGAPENIIGWIDVPSVELSNALMKHPDIDCILATGGPGMVKSAYSSGNPALGVGPGNVSAVIDETKVHQLEN